MFHELVFHRHSLRLAKDWIYVLWDHFQFDINSLGVSSKICYCCTLDRSVNIYWPLLVSTFQQFKYLPVAFPARQRTLAFSHSLMLCMLYLTWQFGFIFLRCWVSGMMFPTSDFSDGVVRSSFRACCSDWAVSSLDMLDGTLLKLFINEFSESPSVSDS